MSLGLLAAISPGRREYCGILSGTKMHRNESAAKKGISPKSRLLKIPGVINFRDLGGYQTRTGQTVKWGQLYRSGDLSKLKPRGLDTISDFGLYAVLDFRSNYEAERRPSRVPEGLQEIHLPVMDQVNRDISQQIRERLKNKEYEGFDPDGLILKAYQQFATEFTPAFKTFIQTVLHARGSPVLWHCSAGKDRTGYAAAILLRLLEVDQSVIYQDYLLSNQYVRRINGQILPAIIARGYKAYKMISPLMSVQKNWLRASFESIDNEWGSFDDYLRDGLALNPSEVQQMRANLLE
jgi:protein-tyrosine phosphatase